MKVVSGKEEARLTYLGISSGVHIEHKKTIFIDIGGGSTEIVTGDQFQYHDLDTLELGAIRLSRMFLSDTDESPVSLFVYKKMKRYTKNKVLRTIERMNRDEIELAIGSSGTIINLAEIAGKMYKKGARKEILYLNREI